MMDKGNGCSFSVVASIGPLSSAVFVVTLILVRIMLYTGAAHLLAEELQHLSVPSLFWDQNDRFTSRFYIAAATDNMTLQKAQLLEKSLAVENGTRVPDTAQFMQIFRSREVGQSYITLIWTTLIATVHALWLTMKIRPQVIIYMDLELAFLSGQLHFHSRFL